MSWQAVLGGLGMVGFCLIHGLAFVALKTDGPVRERAGSLLVRALPAGVLPLAALVVVVQLATGSTLSWLCTCLAVMSVAAAWLAAAVTFVALIGTAIARGFPGVMQNIVSHSAG